MVSVGSQIQSFLADSSDGDVVSVTVTYSPEDAVPFVVDVPRGTDTKRFHLAGITPFPGHALVTYVGGANG